jgi:hypothetical protein
MQTMGGLQQGQTQRNLDLALSDFERQFAQPQEGIDAMIKTIQGIKGALPTGALKQGYGTQPTDVAPSPLSTGISTALGATALYNELKKIFGTP